MNERTPSSHVIVPAGQSAISGLLLALLLGISVIALQVTGSVEWPLLTSVLVFAGAFALGAFVVWAFLMGRMYARVDAVLVPEPTPPSPTKQAPARLFPVIANGVNVAEIQRNERQQRLVEFVQACAESTTVRSLQDRFTQAEQDEFRQVLMRFGFAANRGAEPRQGWRLTISAAEILRRLHI